MIALLTLAFWADLARSIGALLLAVVADHKLDVAAAALLVLATVLARDRLQATIILLAFIAAFALGFKWGAGPPATARYGPPDDGRTTPTFPRLEPRDRT